MRKLHDVQLYIGIDIWTTYELAKQQQQQQRREILSESWEPVGRIKPVFVHIILHLSPFLPSLFSVVILFLFFVVLFWRCRYKCSEVRSRLMLCFMLVVVLVLCIVLSHFTINNFYCIWVKNLYLACISRDSEAFPHYHLPFNYISI